MTQKTLEEQTDAMKASFQAAKEDYAQPDSSVDIGNMYHFALKMEEFARKWQERCENYAESLGSRDRLIGSLSDKKTALQQRVDRMRKALERIAIQNAGTPVAWFNDYAKHALADDAAQK